MACMCFVRVYASLSPCRREVMDAYLRDRAEKLGATVINGLMMRMEQPGTQLSCQTVSCTDFHTAGRPALAGLWAAHLLA